MARYRFASERWLGSVLLPALICGCSGTATPSIPLSAAGRPEGLRLALAPGVRHVFLADAVTNTVTIFSRGTGTRSLSGFNEPQLITTDSAGNLYVANTLDENVEVFAPPYRNAPSWTIPDSGEWPVDVAVAKDGTVAVINICRASGTQCGGAGSVSFFSNAHAESPCATVSRGTIISRTLAAGFAADGTLYVAGVNNYITSRLGVIAGECGAKKLAALHPSTAIHFAAGVQVDTKGNIATVDSGGPTRGTTIDVFAAPKPGSRRLQLVSQQPLDDSSVVASFALTRDGTHLYTAEPQVSNEYEYPQGGYSQGQLIPPGADLIEGVALTPAEVP